MTYTKHLDDIPAERQLRYMLDLLRESEALVLTTEEKAEGRQDDLTDVGLGRTDERQN